MATTTTRWHERTSEIARYLGAVSILVVGGIHAEQYYEAYFSQVPTIGTLFLLSFIGAGIVGAVLLAPVWLLGERLANLILAVAALGAIGIALGTCVGLLVSEYTPLFGFMESDYRVAVVLSLLFDSLAAVFLGIFVIAIWPLGGFSTRPAMRLKVPGRLADNNTEA